MSRTLLKLHRLTTILIVIASALLVASYFFPFESETWSPFKMSFGYGIAGGEMPGPSVLISSIAPYGLGVIVVLSLLLGRWPRAAAAVLAGYFAIWYAGSVIYLVMFFQMPLIRLASVWWTAALIVLPLFAVLILMSFRDWPKQNMVNLLLFVLACGSVVQIAVEIVFCLLEDRLLLNYGAATASAAAATLTMATLYRFRIRKLANSDSHDGVGC